MRVRAYVPLILLASLVCAPSAHAAGPTVSGTVDAAVTAGTVTPDQGAAYKATYTKARSVVRHLPASRKRELRGAMSVVEGLVKRDALPAARMPAAFTQLERNVEWWTAHGPPASSAATGGLPRVAFPGDPIVLQWYPGQGLAIQWLATFGKANALWQAQRTDELRLLLDRAIALAGRRGNGLLSWEYLLAFGGGRAPWVSSIAQGTGIQAFTRGAQLLGNPAYLDVARQALGLFETPPPTGIAVDADGGRHYLLYSFAPRMRVLNAFLQSLVGVLDLAQATGDPGAQTVYNLGNIAAQHELPRFDTGAWSLYAQDGAESTLNYHELVTGFLGSLCTRTANPAYCAAQTRFTAYLHQPPRVAISFGGPRRPRRTMTVRVALSKVSTVALRVRRGSRVILARDLTLRRGTHGFTLKPSRRGTLTVDVEARDLAGNAASVGRTVRVAATS
jgi:D-glucuronyl C5-epimerase C-terminus